MDYKGLLTWPLYILLGFLNKALPSRTTHVLNKHFFSKNITTLTSKTTTTTNYYYNKQNPKYAHVQTLFINSKDVKSASLIKILEHLQIVNTPINCCSKKR